MHKPTLGRLVLLWLFNIIDAGNTLHMLRHEGIYEANPAMRWLLSKGDSSFWIGKIALATFSCLALSLQTHRKSTQNIVWFMFTMFLALIVYQGIMMSFVGAS